MASEDEIESAIYDLVVNYSAWTIGVSSHPSKKREKELEPLTWRHWHADTRQTAQKVVSHFVGMRMRMRRGRGELEPGLPAYVYLFIARYI